jgi:CDP-glycerol glycerophosphotransferase (TagB/SpsB family)
LIRAGYPRNEVIVRPALPLEMIGAELPPAQEEAMRSSKRKILLVPTWQRGVDPLLISTPAFQARLAKWAAANNTIVFSKEHPFVKTTKPADIPGVMYFLPSNGDVYPWMSKFDAMITDYSSIMFDFLLLNRPIFTFNSRTQVAWGFEPDYSLIPQGTFRYEFDATNFESVLERNLADHPLQCEQRTMRAALFETDPAQACDDLLRFVSGRSQAVVEKNFTVTAPQRPQVAAA